MEIENRIKKLKNQFNAEWSKHNACSETLIGLSDMIALLEGELK